ncbi:MAG: hypothetical protein CMP61_11425 [Flavobacteriales bacterium]|nr:hypothetical protein [Flavobacteriales bacterium]
MLEKEHNLNTNPIFAVVKHENHVGKKLKIKQLQSRFESCHPDKQKSFFREWLFLFAQCRREYVQTQECKNRRTSEQN